MAESLTEFLLARIAEDEDEASLFPIGPVDDNMTALVNKFAARVLAECEAKRRIVSRHAHCDETSFGEPCDDLRDLASIYADHLDYREEWRP